VCGAPGGTPTRPTSTQRATSGCAGSAARQSATRQTGQWQRYRITNTCQYDSFNNDLTIDPQTGDVYACANAAPGIGGMVKFDGERWTGFNNFHYGLGVDWPFRRTAARPCVFVRRTGS